MKFWQRFRLAVVVAIVYTLLGVAYTFIGLSHPQKPVNVAEYITVWEIVGHLVFGFIVGMFSFDLIFALETTGMALLIDGGHFVSHVGFPVNPSIDHSITFMILSALIIGYLFRSKFDFKKLVVVTIAAFIAHIAYDAYAYQSSGVPLPLLNPFDFSLIVLPNWSAIPIEILGIVVVAFAFRDNILHAISSFRKRI
jgi:hypothetical protein